MPHETTYTKCSAPDCEAKVPNHYWGRVKKGAGWFFSKDESDAWCPQHLPEWVPQWRAQKGAKV